MFISYRACWFARCLIRGSLGNGGAATSTRKQPPTMAQPVTFWSAKGGAKPPMRLPPLQVSGGGPVLTVEDEVKRIAGSPTAIAAEWKTLDYNNNGERERHKGKGAAWPQALTLPPYPIMPAQVSSASPRLTSGWCSASRRSRPTRPP